MSESFRAALPHDEILEIQPDLFLVRGTYRFMPGFSIPRNMVIARQGDELTLINGVRLSAEGEAALARLGTVKHLVRLGSFHGADDPYLKQRYGARTWAPRGLGYDQDLDGANSPLGEAFRFEGAKEPEGALLLGDTLITCDSFQNWTANTMEKCSWIGRIFMKQAGFRPALIGPFWLKRMGNGVETDFRRIAERPFKHAISGHGEPLLDTARAEFTAEIDRTFQRA